MPFLLRQFFYEMFFFCFVFLFLLLLLLFLWYPCFALEITDPSWLDGKTTLRAYLYELGLARIPRLRLTNLSLLKKNRSFHTRSHAGPVTEPGSKPFPYKLSSPVTATKYSQVRMTPVGFMHHGVV